jgi:hypothetical protein
MDLLSDEEVAEREGEMERLELADRGFYSEPKVCSLCLGPTEDGELCDPCASYDSWMQDRLGSWWS